MSSMGQVRTAFRSKADANHLQFHQIEALSDLSDSGNGVSKPPSLEMESESEEIVDSDPLIVPSSRLNPELCARNSHGQFVNRKKTGGSSEGDSHSQDGD
jgi:hypothetical protein